MDILSDIMSLLRTQGHVYGRIELSAPFGLAFPHQYGICLAMTEGTCLLNLEGGEIVRLSAGDFVFLPTSTTFYLRSHEGGQVNQPIIAEQLAQYQLTKKLEYDGGGQSVSLLAGCFTFTSPESHLLIEQLPPLMHVKSQAASESVQHLVALMRLEVLSDEPGSSAIIDRLAEVLLLQAIRQRFDHACGDTAPGWLNALGDRKIRAALTLMHGDIGAPWTVEQIAREVGMSRSAFAARFKELVGKTPLDHLTEWRMAHAAGLIRNHPDMKIDAVAESTGYQSESSFRKAFHKVMKRSPREYRQVMVKPAPLS
ncbi:AraC family transcriptional regulator [Serratia sp. IR-2025]